jgi:plastocyanin
VRKLLLLIVAMLAIAVPAAGAGTTKTTSVRDDFFSTGKLTISAGTTIVWKWRSTKDPHTVTDTKKRFGSRRKVSGSYQHKFAKAGTYTVYCKVHPTTMRQKIVVR